MGACVREGAFREDLYFRLNVVTLDIPPLSRRPRDIPALAAHFVSLYAEANALPVPLLTEPARRMLLTHTWPGNVRELENTIHRAVLLATDGEIGPEAVILNAGTPPAGGLAASAPIAGGGATGLIGRTVADVERDLIIDTLHHCLGNRTHAANILGISIRTLRNKLRLYMAEGIAVPMPGEGERTLA